MRAIYISHPYTGKEDRNRAESIWITAKYDKDDFSMFYASRDNVLISKYNNEVERKNGEFERDDSDEC